MKLTGEKLTNEKHKQSGGNLRTDDEKRSPQKFVKYEPGTIVADGDLVMVHGRFSDFGLPVNWIAADILRIKDSILVASISECALIVGDGRTERTRYIKRFKTRTTLAIDETEDMR